MKFLKNIILRILILCIITTLVVSCEPSKNNIIEGDNDYEEMNATFNSDKDDITYNIARHYTNYAVDDDGTLYCTSQDFETNNIFVTVMDLDGNIINEVEYNQNNINNLDFMVITVKNGIIYYATRSSFYDGKSTIYSLDITSNEIIELCSVDNFTQIHKISEINGIIYFIGRDDALKDKKYDLNDYSDGFFYNGESIKSFNLESKELSDVFNELPIAFAETIDGNIMIYAYDEKGGYYFCTYDVQSGFFGEKIYNKNTNNLKTIKDFIITNQNMQIMYSYMNLLKLFDVNDNNLSVEINNDINNIVNNAVVYKSGYLFYAEDKGIRRILFSKFFRVPITLNMGYTDAFVNFPTSQGFLINNYELSYDEFALSVLSGDSDIDFYLINSRDTFSDNIRNKGAFYPLNGVPGVTDFINSLFPYVKEAALNEKGEIWMIPYSLQTYSTAYNDVVWERYDKDIKSINSLQELIDTIYYFHDNNIDESYWLNAYLYVEKYFYQLVRKNNGFNKDDFKEMAEYCYNKLNYIKNALPNRGYTILVNKSTKTDVDSCIGGLFNSYSYSGPIGPMGVYGINSLTIGGVIEGDDFNDYEQARDDLHSGKRLSFIDSSYTHLRNTVIPAIKGGDKNDVTCEFFYVNPNSKNLDVVLEYISAYCESVSKEKNTFLLNDKDTYDNKVFIQDNYDIYSDGYIRFSLSKEVFFNDFEKYLIDKISIDEFLTTVEYKLNAYFNE